MAENSIIAIGRQFGSGGHEVGRRIAAELGLKLYDKELLKTVAEQSNICEQVLQDYDEKPTNSLLYSIVMDVYPSMNYVGNTLSQQVYQAQYETIRRLGEKGGCVIVGRAADYILRDNPRLTSVFIHSSMRFRLDRVMEFEHIDEGAASSYNLSLDTSDIGIDGCVRMIELYLEQKKKGQHKSQN